MYIILSYYFKFMICFIICPIISNFLSKIMIQNYNRTNLYFAFILSKTDIIIEVAHPIISENYGVKFLENGSDYMVIKLIHILYYKIFKFII